MKDARTVRQSTEGRFSLAGRVQDIWIFQPPDRQQDVRPIMVDARHLLHKSNYRGIWNAQGSFVASFPNGCVGGALRWLPETFV